MLFLRTGGRRPSFHGGIILYDVYGKLLPDELSTIQRKAGSEDVGQIGQVPARQRRHSFMAVSTIAFQFQCLSSMSTALSKMTSPRTVHVCIIKCMRGTGGA